MDEYLIIEQIKNGTNSGYKYIYEKHYNVMCYVAYKYVKDKFVAESIVDDIIFHIWEIRDKLEINGSLRSYLMQAVRNRCINYLNSQIEQKEIPIDSFLYDNKNNDMFASYSDYPLDDILYRELESKIKEAIDNLPIECKTVFIKSRYEGKKYEEISTELDISVNTVKYHIKNALVKICDYLKKYLIIFLFMTTLYLFKIV